jgi:Flp pilus assembly pilin Flp
MLAKIKKLTNRRRGQGMTEYIIIVGLIAILLIGAVTRFRDALGGAFDAATGKVTNDITNQINQG